MKYIRTKDGIIDLDKYVLCHVDNDFYIFKSKKHRKNGQDYTKLYKKFILREADTIKELCDEFVGIDNDKPQMLRFVPYACAHYWNGGVYGAIWTDKGLIYVAKMNKKGELELL